MGTRGTSFTSEATVEIAGYEFSDAVIEGNTNTSILGLKTETVVGGLGIGVAGVWTDVAFVKMEFSNLKLGVNYGSIGEFHYGWKYERSPVGTFESHDTLFQIIQGAHWTDTQQIWHVSAGTSATINAATISLSGTAMAGISSCADPADPASPRATLLMTPATAALTIGPTVQASLSLDGNETLVKHPTLVKVACGTANLQLAPAVMSLNAATTQVNGNTVTLGMPPMDNPALAAELANLQAQSQALQAQLVATAAAQQKDLATLVYLLTDSIV